MDGLDYPDLHHARAADGWLDLGRPQEAAAELAILSQASAANPGVLDLYWRLESSRLNWERAAAIAHEITCIAPWLPNGWIHRSYALHELRRTEEALGNLLKAEPQFPTNSLIPYNIACYLCQLGDLESARRWLQRTVELKGLKNLQALAAEDPDLAPLREEIASW